MPYSLTPLQRKTTASYIVLNNVFSNSECKSIIELHKSIPSEEGVTQSKDQYEKRVSTIRWIQWQVGVDIIFAKLADVVNKMNAKHWEFHLSSFWEPLQLTHYKAEEGGKYDWHPDLHMKGMAMNRKISGTLLLNDNFEGGKFEMFDTPETENMNRGDVILFPSYAVHRVGPVTKGERWSLVFWVSGPPWV